MKKNEILELARHNVLRVGLRNPKMITHPRNPGVTYVPYQVVESKQQDGSWAVAVLYQNSEGDTYCRNADDFEKFSEVRDA